MRRFEPYREVVIVMASSLMFVLATGALLRDSSSDRAATSARKVSQAPRRGEGASATPSWIREGAERNDYSAVFDRDMFRSGERPDATATTRELPPAIPVPNARITAVVNQQQGPVPTPKSEGICVVGRVTIDGIEQAVVEDLRRQETQWVPVGETAFGYRVVALSNEGAVLERDGRRFELGYGENKPDARPRAASSSTTATTGTSAVSPPLNLPLVVGATDAASPRSWDWRNMTAQQRSSAEEYVRTRRSRDRSDSTDRSNRTNATPAAAETPAAQN